MSKGNPRNYPLDTLAELATRRRTVEMTLRRQLEEDLKRSLLAVQMQFESELLTARQHGVGVTLLADTTGYSRPYMYEVLKRANAAGWYIAPEPVKLPHGDIFALTGRHASEIQLTEGDDKYHGYVAHTTTAGWEVIFERALAYAVSSRLRAQYSTNGPLNPKLAEWAGAAFQTPPTREQAEADRNEAEQAALATTKAPTRPPADTPDQDALSALYDGVDDE